MKTILKTVCLLNPILHITSQVEKENIMERHIHINTVFEFSVLDPLSVQFHHVKVFCCTVVHCSYFAFTRNVMLLFWTAISRIFFSLFRHFLFTAMSLSFRLQFPFFRLRIIVIIALYVSFVFRTLIICWRSPNSYDNMYPRFFSLQLSSWIFLMLSSGWYQFFLVQRLPLHIFKHSDNVL